MFQHLRDERLASFGRITARKRVDVLVRVFAASTSLDARPSSATALPR